jgi:hypothetical protein
MMPYELTYLFVAETTSGQIIKQDPTDKPRFSKWGTIFTDVLKENLKKFSLVGKGHLFTVDLIDGHFEVDGRLIYSKQPPTGVPLRLIYYRQVQQTTLGDEPKVRYYIGWQATSRAGKNCKMELGFD